MSRPGVLKEGSRRPFRRRYLVAFVALGAGATAVTGAYAYWTASGSGTGSGAAGTLQTVTIDSVTFDGGTLRPGGPNTAVHIPATNSNSFAVDITSLAAGPIHSDKSGCDGADTGVTVDLSGVTGSIPPNTTTSFTAPASMSTASVSACQGATFSTQLTLVVRK